MVGVPIGADEYVLERAIEIEKDGGSDRISRCCANMPDKQAVAFIYIEYLGHRTGCLERALDTEPSLEACRRADTWEQWTYDKILELPGSAEAQSVSQEGCPDM